MQSFCCKNFRLRNDSASLHQSVRVASVRFVYLIFALSDLQASAKTLQRWLKLHLGFLTHIDTFLQGNIRLNVPFVYFPTIIEK